MRVWATLRCVRTGLAIALLSLSGSQLRADEQSAPPTLTQLRLAAEAAEKAGDWEAAFNAYCRIFVADRNAPEIREKLSATLRRTHQLRRHRDPQFQQYVGTVPVSDGMNLFAEVFTKVPVLYVDRARATPQILWENAIDELNRALANPVFRQAFLDTAQAEKIDVFRNGLRFWSKMAIEDARAARIALRKLLASAKESFPARVPSALVIEMVFGSCSGLDEYTVFLNPGQVHPASTSAVPDLSAQGIYLTIVEGRLLVAGIANGSWTAHHAPNLMKADHIIAVNGHTMAGATSAIVAEALRNPVDGFHVLELAASDTDSLPVVIHLPVVVPTVFAESIVAQNRSVGYARIGSFSPGTPRELDEAVARLKGNGARALVLDLRGNMGGSFMSGVDTAKRLLPSGVIVTTQGQAAEVDNISFSSDSGMTAHDIPIVVLVDSETASAAEVLAAALKDNNRATLIGMPTFGKGAIQYPVRMTSLDERDENGNPRTNRSGAVRLTIARLLAPGGEPINGTGVRPHLMEANSTRQLELGIIKAAELMPTTMRPMPPMTPINPMVP